MGPRSLARRGKPPSGGFPFWSGPHNFRAVPIYHIATAADWEARTDEYRAAPSLESEGFIHCSTEDQVDGIAQTLFAGRDDLYLLTIETENLESDVVFEDLYDAGEEFPHIYGPIPTAAIVTLPKQFPRCRLRHRETADGPAQRVRVD